MADGVSVTLHFKEFDKALAEDIEKALTACGIRAEEVASGLCPVDTGLLRNSITFALDGEEAHKGAYKADKGGEAGKYDGIAEKENNGRAVLLGTNVEYAIYVENGARGRDPVHFLRRAIMEHKADYEEIIKKLVNTKA